VVVLTDVVSPELLQFTKLHLLYLDRSSTQIPGTDPLRSRDLVPISICLRRAERFGRNVALRERLMARSIGGLVAGQICRVM
jgi:hypothetical protein